ncbi:FAD-binding oxidoreductase [Haladaptatus sp. T7]|uniref:FAD-binding oxidoreductase n=1 Tax=Haladaptatus sp. T7 TaxID=2029368 RepID=UPI0021A259FC|nr:FAD-binding oxidoreductase [Haladaptatus sp. T7]GKZ14289.1 FAD-linked oxidase [Haladaptatus sp. T7]
MAIETTETGVEPLRAQLKGELVTPDDPDYDEERSVWNGMINKRPAMVARCDGVADVRAAVNVAREYDLPVAVRGGGHGVAGRAVVDGGLVIDLEPMHWVRVDPETRRVRAGAGATWGDVDRETQPFGLAVPGGVVSDTGIAGLTLGGGMGHLRRKYGLSCDNLVSADVVTADGEFLTASEDEHEDLFWALRGGGGNFGIVTAFEYEAHPVGPDVATCFVWYDGEQAEEVLRKFRAYAADAPDEVSLLPFYAWVPDLPEFPEESWGDSTVALLGCYAGDPAEGEAELQPVREFAEPITDFSGTMPYVELQSMLDEDYPNGRYYYWKSLYIDELSDDIIDAIVGCAERCPVPLSTVDVWQGGGALSRVGETETAFAHRDAPYGLNFEANWDDPRQTDAAVAWVRESVAEMREFPAVRGQYVNFPGLEEESSEVPFGENADRLAEIKAEYDPEGVFRAHGNLEPRA